MRLRPDETSVQSPRLPPPTLQLGVALATVLGSAPALTMGLRIETGLVWRHFALLLEGRADLPGYADVAREARVGTTLVAAALLPCARFETFYGCALFSGGAVLAEGQGFSPSRSEWVPYAGLGARVGLDFPLQSHFVVRTLAELQAPLTRVVLADPVSDTRYWSAPPVHGALGVGFLALF